MRGGLLPRRSRGGRSSQTSSTPGTWAHRPDVICGVGHAKVCRRCPFADRRSHRSSGASALARALVAACDRRGLFERFSRVPRPVFRMAFSVRGRSTTFQFFPYCPPSAVRCPASAIYRRVVADGPCSSGWALRQRPSVDARRILTRSPMQCAARAPAFAPASTAPVPLMV